MDSVAIRHLSLPAERSCVQPPDHCHRRRTVSNVPKPAPKPKPIHQSRTRSLFSHVRRTLFSLPAVDSEEKINSGEKQDFSKEMRRLNATREKMDMERKRNSKLSVSSGYFSPNLNTKKRIANDTFSRNSMHSRSSYTPLDFSAANIRELPPIRLDGPLEINLRKLLPANLYLSLGFCMGHPEYFPGDAESEITMPWPSYSLSNCQEQVFETTEPPFLRAATLNGIVHALSCQGATDNALLSDFLRTYHYCVSGEDLLRMLFVRYINCLLAKENSSAEWHSIVQLKLLNVIKKWVNHYQAIIQRNPSLYEFAQGVLEFIDQVEENRTRFIASILTDLESQPEPESPMPNIAISDSYIVGLCEVLNYEVLQPTALSVQFQDLDPKVVAQQLTLIEHKLFSAIQPEEIYHQAWNDRLNRDRTSPNLWSMIQVFNRVAHFIGQQITKPQPVHSRVSTVVHAVRIGLCCLKFNNFNSAFEILAGLNTARLTKSPLTWQALPARTKRGFHKLSNALATRENYKEYRERLRQVSPPTKPVLPFVGISLTDLVFAENGNSTYFLPGDEQPAATNWHFPSPTVYYINNSKLRLMSSIMSHLLSFQRIPYHFEESTSIQSWILQVMLAEQPTADV